LKLIILDRDGVVNYDSDNYIKSVEEFIPLPGSIDAIARLNKAGYKVAIATNQSGIARGYYNVDTLNAMHHKLSAELSKVDGHIDYIAFCPHGPDDHCNCRKPLTGLLEQIAHHFNTKLTNVPVVGDSLRDLQSAQAVGASPMLVESGKGERTIAKGKGIEGIPLFTDLAAAVDNLIGEN